VKFDNVITSGYLPKPSKDGTLPPSVILYSGGLDTYILLRGLVEHYKGQEHLIHALTIDYGQRNWRELYMAKKVCRKYGVTMYPQSDTAPTSWPFLQLPTVRGGGGSMVNTGDASDYEKDGHMETQRGTNVANRNVIFIAYAQAWAEVVGAEYIYWGALDIQSETLGKMRPDSTYEVINLMQGLCQKSTYVPARLHGPFWTITKSQMIRRAANCSIDIDFGESYTCYTNSWPPCGECRACKERARAFERAGIDDVVADVDPCVGMVQGRSAIN